MRTHSVPLVPALTAILLCACSRHAEPNAPAAAVQAEATPQSAAGPAPAPSQSAADPALAPDSSAADLTPAPRRLLYVAVPPESESYCESGGCQWRLFDPGTRSDQLFLPMRKYPANVSWDGSFDSVTYRDGDRIFRCAWKQGAVPEEIATLPKAPWVEKIWKDGETGRWRFSEMSPNNDGKARMQELSPQGDWKVIAEVDASCECDGCPCAGVLDSEIRSPGTIFEDEMDREIVSEIYRRSQRMNPSESMDGNPLFFPSEADQACGISVVVMFNELGNVEGPVRYLDNRNHREKMIYDIKDRDSYTLGLAEVPPFMLLTGDVSPRVIDSRTGEILFSSETARGRAVWVPPLRP